MQLVIPASPSRLAGLRRAVRAHLRGVQDEVADEVVLALNEVATNAVLYGSSGASRSRWSSRSMTGGLRRRCWIMVRSRQPGAWRPPTLTSSALADVGCGCCAGWWMRCALNGSGSVPG